MRHAQAGLLLVSAFALAACGGGDGGGGSSGGSGASGGSGGSTAGSGGSTAGSAGGGSGGTTGDGVAPAFDGVETASAVTESRIQLSWTPADDNVTPGSRMAYRVYVANAAGGQDFAAPHITTPSGASGALISDLDPALNYFFTVRAVDEAGNEDDNTVEASATTPDESPPKFAGVSSVEADGARALDVSWNPAFDAGSAEATLTYRVYFGETETGVNFDSPEIETSPGETTARIEGLDPLTDYSVVVRAVDEAGNEDTNTLARSAFTPEGESPVFFGATQAIATGQSIKVYWQPASDNVTEQANIIYDIYESQSSNGQNFASPTYTSEPGQIDFIAQNLLPGVRYYYVVRARDVAKNSDANVVQVNARTTGETDNGPPTFGGVQSVTGTSPSTLEVSWNAATDDVSPASRIVYDIFVSDTSGGQSFATPSFTTPAGVTSTVLTGLAANATRFVVVRARDESGKSLSNTTEASGTTLMNSTGNTTGPTWAAGPIVTQVTAQSGRLMVDWTEATDDNHSAAEIRYHVCAETDPQDCEGTSFNTHIRATTGFGETTVTLQGLLHRTAYNVYVRAEDMSGNFETGSHSDVGTTAVSYTDNVLPLWRDHCNQCHSFEAATTVNVPGGYVDPQVDNGGVGLFLVAPGSPENSLIYRRINPVGLEIAPFSVANPNNYVGTQEPRNGDGLTFTALSGAEDGIIREWIEQGAVAN